MASSYCRIHNCIEYLHIKCLCVSVFCFLFYPKVVSCGSLLQFLRQNRHVATTVMAKVTVVSIGRILLFLPEHNLFIFQLIKFLNPFLKLPDSKTRKMRRRCKRRALSLQCKTFGEITKRKVFISGVKRYIYRLLRFYL